MQIPLHRGLPPVSPWGYRGTLVINAERTLYGYRLF